MNSRKEKNRMSLAEIQELLDLTGMSRTQLAGALDLTEATVHKWFRTKTEPGGPAKVLMQTWLAEARNQSRARANGRKKVRV